MKQPESKFIIDGSSVLEVIEIGDGFLVPSATVFKREKYILFDSREDARYFCMVQDLKKGKPIEQYKSSKYYQYYLERLKEEYPEYVI